MSSHCNLWVALLCASCATAPAARTTWSEPSARTTWTEPTYQRVRPGVIESVDKIEEHGKSDASADVFLGLIVGGLVFSGLLYHGGTGSVVGAEEGQTSVAASDGESTSLPRYRVVVRFDDSGSMTLVYTNDVKFHRGERVLLTQDGVVSAETMQGAREPAERPEASADRSSSARREASPI